MEIYFENTNISEYVDVKKCICRDTSKKKYDSVEIEFEGAETWYQWKAQKNDCIRITDGIFDSGKMYLQSIIPENGKFRILASAVKLKAKEKGWDSFRNLNIKGICDRISAKISTEIKLFGINGDIIIPYIERENESYPAFLARLFMLEGAVLKARDNCLIGIGIEYAQKIAAKQIIRLDAGRDGYAHFKDNEQKLSGVVIQTPYAGAKAEDRAENSGEEKRFTQFPAMDNYQAKRWAKGILLDRNREAEEIILKTELKREYTAMARLDIDGTDEISGAWIIHEAEHDLKEGKTEVKLYRVIETIV